MGTEFLLHGVVSGHGHPVTRLPVRRDDAIGRVVERQRKIEKKRKDGTKHETSAEYPVVAPDGGGCWSAAV